MKLSDYLKPIFLMVICTIFIAAGQFIWKFSVMFYSNQKLLSYAFLFLGFVFYILGGILMIFALKKGQLSVIQPMISLGYVWVCLLSPIMFVSEVMTANKWIAIMLLFLGIFLIAYGGRK